MSTLDLFAVGAFVQHGGSACVQPRAKKTLGDRKST